jgi:hypothetical protein
MVHNTAVKEQLLQSQAKVESLQRLSRSLQAEHKTQNTVYMANLEQFKKSLHVSAAHSIASDPPAKTLLVSTHQQLRKSKRAGCL